MRIAIPLGLLVCIVALASFTVPARASTLIVDHGGVYFGDVVVERDQVVHGDLTVLGGNATVEGEIDGDLNVVGGSVDQRPGSTITGEVTDVGGDGAPTIAPWLPSMHGWRITLGIFADIVVLLVFLIFPARVRIALDRLERHPGLCGAVGLGGFVAVIPLAIVLAMTVVLIPLVPAELVALVAGIFIGKAALSLLVGRRLCEMLQPNATPSAAAALLVGLVLVTAAELVPIVGGLVTGLVWMVGLGAAILAFVNERGFGPPAAAEASRAPIAGPPMTIG
ncbi:MAG TPA: hypothetical protein VMS32_02245 [Verrucomicrobiae bacterium]|jgi:hypothetical protein|nr:hypothetical protein [Verrucomicrobiae bacterium]